ncbi:hypothetical protein SMB34_02325 [Thalassospira permensis NBRC 106175]|uniref:Uncharacterized protein n=1 Tax=Thalassospira permensis NBRC 106175 TaxID=1353532 RepID=A0ABR4TW60_9PROT|nr:hypothetical protein SMB34_02325 [Thalassospira permensis NBRC 106175]
MPQKKEQIKNFFKEAEWEGGFDTTQPARSEI